MYWSDAKKYVKDHLQDYLEDLKDENGSYVVEDVRKPFYCLNPKHDDHHPSMVFYIDRATGEPRVRCLSVCNKSFDTFDLIRFETEKEGKPLSGKALFMKAFEMFGLEVEPDPELRPDPRKDYSKINDFNSGDTSERGREAARRVAILREEERYRPIERPTPTGDYMDYFRKCRARVDETSYLILREITREVIERFWVGYDPEFHVTENGPAWDAIIFPTSRTTFTVRNTRTESKGQGKTNRYRDVGSTHIFNIKAVDSAHGPLWVVEGIIDALSIESIGSAAVGLNSTAQVRQFVAHLRDHPTSRPVIVALDNDEAGNAAADDLMRDLHDIGMTPSRFDWMFYNDPNSALMSMKRPAFQRLISEFENGVMTR